MPPLAQAGLNKINDLLMLGLAVSLYGNWRAEFKMDMPVAADRAKVSYKPAITKKIRL